MDREILIVNQGSKDQGAVGQIRRYFQKVWNLEVCKTKFSTCSKNKKDKEVKGLLSHAEKVKIPNYDYQKNRSKILDTGISLYEYMGRHSTHGKSLIIDNDIAVVGSYNFDCRSTYVDTETMLVVQGKEITRQLQDDFDGLKSQSLQVKNDGSYQKDPDVKESTMENTKKTMIKVLSYIIQAFRYLA